MQVRAQDGGFTLVELMVVVAIVVILIALLIPALEGAMEAGEKAKCLAHVRQISVQYRLYAADHNGDVVYSQAIRGEFWHHKLGRHMGLTDFGRQSADGWPDFLRCPNAAWRGADGFGDARTNWHYDTGESAYGLNLWLANYPGGDAAYNPNHARQDAYHIKFDRATGNTPVVGDSVWIGSWPYADESPPLEYHSGTPGHIGQYVIDRHTLTVNLSFVDGSARNMRFGELWTVPWHREFKVRYNEGLPEP